jgi:hypothetical protein
MLEHLQNDEYYELRPRLSLPKEWPPQWELNFSKYSYIVVTSAFVTEQKEFLEPYEVDIYLHITSVNALQLWRRKLSRAERIDYLNDISYRADYASYGEEGFVGVWPLDAGQTIYLHAIDFQRYQYIVLEEEESNELKLTPADGWIKHNSDVVGNTYRELWRKKRRTNKTTWLMKLLGLKESIGL